MKINGKERLQWLTPSVIIQIIVWVFMLAFYASNITAHINENDIHMSYKDKVSAFVPKGEFILLQKQLDRIEEHTKSLEEYVRNNK